MRTQEVYIYESICYMCIVCLFFVLWAGVCPFIKLIPNECLCNMQHLITNLGRAQWTYSDITIQLCYWFKHSQAYFQSRYAGNA